MLRFTISLFLVLAMQITAAAQAVPNCRDINASVNAFGQIQFRASDLITNAGAAIDSVTISITDSRNTLLFGPAFVSVNDSIVTEACAYIGKILKISVRNDFGACWSELTVKKTQGPFIFGRTFDVYCFDTIINKPITSPTTIDACGSHDAATFVADWITLIPCQPGIQDTIKVIYREWESVGKDGLRGVGYDTIVVFAIPEITPENIYCIDKDTVYCSDIDSLVGPIITIPELPLNPATCLDIPLIKVRDLNKDGILEFSANLISDLCGLNVHIDSEIFEVDCSKQYRVTLDLKLSCYGAPQTTCIVPVPAGTPPNVAQNLAPGYWRCQFWVIDYDTLPPDLHCKYPILFSGNLDNDHWYTNIFGDGLIDTTWAPYKISLVGNDNGNAGGFTDYCIDVVEDTVLAFAWEYRSQNTDAGNDPFGYILNDVFYQLTTGVFMVEPGSVYQNGYKIIELRSGDQFCFSQQSLDGMAGPAITTIKPLPVISTSQHDCVAHAYIPPVRAFDDWSGIKQVKARIPNIGTYVLTYNTQDTCYESHERAELPHRAEPYLIIYEAQDSCHNTTIDTCYILVKDRTRPTAVVDKGITVSLSEKKVWLEAKDFDEGSFDNCQVNLLLVRRSDWYESCIDLCDSLNHICVNTHGDTLWKPYLETDKEIDEVEAHYSKNLQWWKEDGGPCTSIIYNAWIYDLIKRGTQHCIEHPYDFSDDRTKDLIGECLPTVMDYFLPVALHPDPYREGEEVDAQEDFKVDDRLLQTYEQIGGGWSDAVPFDCTDACGSVIVEILVMDFWCNWSTAWTQVWVEDKVPAKVVQDLEDIDITCKIYKTPQYDLEGQNIPLSIASIIDLAKEKDAVALGALDAIFGGYQKVWKGPYGNYLDEDGKEVRDYIPFTDSSCYCEIDEIIQTRVFDEHLGYYWKTDTIYDCGYDAVRDTFTQGLVLANCANYVDCSQEVWCDIDHCGEGYIYRKFKIWQGCLTSWYQDDEVPKELKEHHLPDTVTRIQRIRIFNECGLDPHMFEVPVDQELVSCGIQYANDGSGKVAGVASPDQTGWLRYRFDDDCRLVGIGYDDKVFKIVGGQAACYKILRTWYYMDWCEGQPVDDHWYHNTDLPVDSFVQHIFLIDTLPPLCTIVGPTEDGGTVEVGDCLYNFRAGVEMEDSCGITSYYWGLYRLDSMATPLLITDYQSPQLKAPQTSFNVSVDSLSPGDYKLKALVTDDCGNEGECLYHFSVLTVKKPTAICITSLTARLNPMDLNQNGLVDTALVTLWASEYDRSSRVACNDTTLEFRLELKDGIDDDTWQEDVDSIQLGCQNIGTEIVRLWVISWPSGTVDYCDLVAIIRSNVGCPEELVEPEDSVFSVMESETELLINMPTNQTKKFDTDPYVDIQVPLKLDVGLGEDLEQIELLQNFPNPFSSETTIRFTLPRNLDATIRIFNINGQVIKTTKGKFSKGENEIRYSRDLFGPGGIYYYQLQTADYQNTKRMVFIK